MVGTKTGSERSVLCLKLIRGSYLCRTKKGPFICREKEKKCKGCFKKEGTWHQR